MGKKSNTASLSKSHNNNIGDPHTKPQSHAVGGLGSAGGHKNEGGAKCSAPTAKFPVPGTTNGALKYNAVTADGPDIKLERDGAMVRLPLIPVSECHKILAMTQKFDDWNALTDSVDRKSENQHLIYDYGKNYNDGVLWPFCEEISQKVLEPVLKRHLGLTGLKLHWVFIRKYNLDGRLDFPVHRDTSAATVNILLSDPADYTGGELYLLPPEHKNADQLHAGAFKRQFPEATLRSRFGVSYVQGEAVTHFGKRLHGVLPLTSGYRYTLILMYYP